jgi:hypothetical protein
MSQPAEVYPVSVIAPGGGRLSGEFWVWEEDPEDPEKLRLELHFAERVIVARSRDSLFDALISVRREMEGEGLLLACYGCSRNVYPSRMSLDMGSGDKAYILEMGRKGRAKDMVSIFETGPEVIPVTLAEQEENHRNWLASLEQGLPEESE